MFGFDHFQNPQFLANHTPKIATIKSRERTSSLRSHLTSLSIPKIAPSRHVSASCKVVGQMVQTNGSLRTCQHEKTSPNLLQASLACRKLVCWWNMSKKGKAFHWFQFTVQVWQLSKKSSPTDCTANRVWWHFTKICHVVPFKVPLSRNLPLFRCSEGVWNVISNNFRLLQVHLPNKDHVGDDDDDDAIVFGHGVLRLGLFLVVFRVNLLERVYQKWFPT